MFIITGCMPESNQVLVTGEQIETVHAGNMELHFLDVGQGDATLIVCDGESMLIDAGDEDKGTLVQNYLQKKGIRVLKYVIGTHPHADHIGGMDVILTKFDVEQLLIPNVKADTKAYDNLIQAANYKRINPRYPELGETYSLGSATFTILSSGKNDYGDNLNNCSLSILLTNGNDKMIFTGDAEEEAELSILDTGILISADFYHIGQHGSKTSSNQRFLDAINPTYALISCGSDNKYGHPHADTMNKLRQMGVKVYRTDEDGTIIATSSGYGITWDIPASNSWQVGNVQGISIEQEEDETLPIEHMMYVLNKNSFKIHLPECPSVEKIADQNREYSNKSIEEFIAENYNPCKVCNP